MIINKLNDIFSECCKEFGLSEEVVKSRVRTQDVVYCRKVFCAIVKEKYDISYDILARILGISKVAVRNLTLTEPNNKYYSVCKLNVLHTIDKWK